MRIAHVINALRVGGAEELLLTLAGELRRRGIDLTIITLRPSDPEMLAQAAGEGARVVAFPHRKLWAPGRFYRLQRFLRAERFSVLHTHLTMANILGTAAGRLAGTPVVTSLHNTTMRSQSMPLHSLAETWLLRTSVQRIIAVGWETARTHRARLNGKPLLVLPNAVSFPPPLSPAERSALRRELGCGNPEAPLLIFVGRLVPQKGLGDLLQAFAGVHQAHPAARLLLVGEGPLQEEVQAQVRSLGLGGQVSLLGLRSDVQRLLGACDLFVSAAHWEGLPVASLEAMAAGLPLAVTAVGDLPRVVTPETGALTPPQDPEALAEAINALLASPERRAAAGAAAQARVRREFSAEAWAGRLLDLYDEVRQEEAHAGAR